MVEEPDNAVGEITGGSGLPRRRVLAAAAWSAPVIAIVTSVPAVAASLTPTIEFTEASYAGAACAVLDDITVFATTDGATPAALASVTVTLSGGYTFEDTTTVFSGTTDAGGFMTLPGVLVPAVGGAGTFAATYATADPASAPVSAPPGSSVVTKYEELTVVGTISVPMGTTPIGADYYVTPASELLYLGNPIAGATDVQMWSTLITPANEIVDWALTVNSAGVAKRYRGGVLVGTFTNLPAGTIPVGVTYALAPSTNNFYRLNTQPNATLLLGNVTSADSVNNGNNNYAGVINTSNQHIYYTNGSNGIVRLVDPGSVAVGAGFWLTPAGDLYQQVTATTGRFLLGGVTSVDDLNDSATQLRWRGDLQCLCCLQ